MVKQFAVSKIKIYENNPRRNDHAVERMAGIIEETAGVASSDRKEFNHATPKPVALFALPIEKHLKSGEIAFEPFAGSGPQYIAAEQLGRRCFGLELSPSYCDVIVERWQKLTGGRAKRG